MHNINDLGELISKVLEAQTGLNVRKFLTIRRCGWSIRFMPSFLKLLGWKRFIHLLITLIPDGLQLLRGIPKLSMMVEFNRRNRRRSGGAESKRRCISEALLPARPGYEINGFEEDPTEGKSEKFWIMRRYSFQLLRSKVKDKHTAPVHRRFHRAASAPAYGHLRRNCRR